AATTTTTAAGAIARSSAASATTTSAATGRRSVAAANLHAAPVADIHVDLFAVVTAHLPAQERCVECRFTLGVGDLHVEVIEHDGLPPGRLERRLERRLITRRGRVAIPPGALPLGKRARQRHRHGREAECLEQMTPRDGPAIVVFEES